MIEVHHYKVLNLETGSKEIADCMRTAEAIAELKGEVVPESEQLVFQGMLDSEGRYFPPKYGKNGA
ncbi:MAG: hypothetical protein K8F90_20575 [Hyphomicrobiales bacterium]|nr:hypothetical protein [Hyphomicrobiales bacterium]